MQGITDEERVGLEDLCLGVSRVLLKIHWLFLVSPHLPHTAHTFFWQKVKYKMKSLSKALMGVTGWRPNAGWVKLCYI